MALPRPSRPGVVLADLRAFFAGNRRHKLLFGALAILMPAIIVLGFIVDARTNILPGPSITYINSWPATRTDAEIVAQQKIDQAAKVKAEAEKRAAYRRLADKLGIE